MRAGDVEMSNRGESRDEYYESPKRRRDRAGTELAAAGHTCTSKHKQQASAVRNGNKGYTERRGGYRENR